MTNSSSLFENVENTGNLNQPANIVWIDLNITDKKVLLWKKEPNEIFDA